MAFYRFLTYRQDEQIEQKDDFSQDENPEQDEEMQCSCPAELTSATTLENLLCVAVIGFTSYSIYNKLDLGAQISKQVFINCKN